MNPSRDGVPTRLFGGDTVRLPQDRQRHMLALELTMHRRPVRLGETPLALPAAAADLREQPGFQYCVSDVIKQRPGQPRCLETADPVEGADPPGDLAARHPGRLQSHHIAHVAHRKPLRRHPGPPSQKPKGGTVSEPEEAS